ncbi:putative inorganic carbon transporter subunit DabA, partial [Salibaculum halophilum]|uniref:putative inorganic carbon transporter subunit DabA n=1 Tax=Salibaculum halophilum TaxID=1914408 RepID=UPI001C4F9C4C
MTHDETTRDTQADILAAVEAATRALPPAFPLDATVAVNPFLGQTGEDLATAAARLRRVAGAEAVRPHAAHAEAIAAGRITDADLS